MAQSTESAVRAALAVAREHDLHCGEPAVLRADWHILLHLAPLPIVARVSTGLPYPEGPDPNDLVRELDVAAHAARAGAAVVPPANDIEPGPHERDGHIITFWRYVEPYADADPAEAGRALRGIHDALATYDGELPDASRRADVEAMANRLPRSEDTELLLAVAARPLHLARQALHGDAHLSNCLGSPAGPLWHDFETACRGPREYDLAALVMRHRVVGDDPCSTIALRAYGDHDATLVDMLVPHYLAWVAASMLTAVPRRPELAAVAEVRMAWLRKNFR